MYLFVPRLRAVSLLFESPVGGGGDNAKKNTRQVSSCERTSVIYERLPTFAILAARGIASRKSRTQSRSHWICS